MLPMNKTQSKSNSSKRRISCRVCQGSNLQKVLSLGSMPPANAFLKKENLNRPEKSFPLELYFCNDCSFVQLLDIVSPKLLFEDYVYVSSTSPVFVAHFKELTRLITNRFSFPANPFIIDIGSNDGILLRPFKEMGWRVLGVDPAKKIAAIATKNGIETMPKFFNPEIAKKIIKKYGRANLITSTSSFPHIDNLDEIIAGVKELLSSDGIFIIEAYYLLDLIEKNLFDTIYHEHLSYFTVKTIKKLFERLGLELFNIEKTDTHGGSLRIFAQKNNGPHPINKNKINSFIKNEEKMGLNKISTYKQLFNKIEKNRKKLFTLLKDLKNQNKTIIGYGAPAKGNTLLNYFQIGPEILNYIIDDSPWKQGLYTPGTHIPIVSLKELLKKQPDYILILAWNFAGPIMKKLSSFSEKGTKFIIPIPKPKIF